MKKITKGYKLKTYQNKEDLEKEKLYLEIKKLREPVFKQITFWPPFLTFLIAVTAYFSLWKNGIFDAKQAHLTYVTDTLRAYKIKLDSSIANQKKDTSSLANTILERKRTLDSVQRIIDSIKKKFAFHEKQELTKKQLIKECSAFITDLSKLTTNYRSQSSYLSNKYLDESRDAGNDTSKRRILFREYGTNTLDLSEKFMADYRLNYQSKTIFYKQEFCKYFPENNPRIISDYQKATNVIGVENVTADLNLLITKLKSISN